MEQQVVPNGSVARSSVSLPPSSGGEEEGKGDGEAAAAAAAAATSSAFSSFCTFITTSASPVPAPLQRHYSTIGIGDVFAVLLLRDDDGGGPAISPPPLPSSYLLPQRKKQQEQQQTVLENSNNDAMDGSFSSCCSFTSWEVVGTIKSVPEDFIVREIGLFDGSRPSSAASVANGVEEEGRKKQRDGAGAATCISSSYDNDGGCGGGGNCEDENNNKADVTSAASKGKIRRRSFDVPGLSPRQLADMRVADIPLAGEEEDPSGAVAATAEAVTAAASKDCDSGKQPQRSSNNKAHAVAPAGDTGSTTVDGNGKKTPEQQPTSSMANKPAISPHKSPFEVLRTQLQHCCRTTPAEDNGPGAILKALDQLNERAKELLSSSIQSSSLEEDKGTSSGSSSNHEVCFSTSAAALGGKDKDSTTFDRGAFHRAIRLAYPLLHANSVEEENKTDGQRPPANSAATDDDLTSTVKKRKATTFRIRVTIEDIFHSLIPSLYEPSVDIPALYLFLKSGNNNGKQNTILRLRPDLPRSERRPIHQTIENQTKSSLATRTLPEYECSSSEPSTMTSMKTAAIAVYWSKTAGRRANKKKRKRAQQHKGLQAAGAQDPYPHLLFVVKKTQIEHLNLLQILTAGFNIRQADIGLAGIKDMKAVTYQFCTLRDYQPVRLLRAQEALNRRRIEIGNVHKVNWTLSKGELKGNRFEIIIRNTRRVRVTREENDIIREDFVTCDSAHLQAMVDRLKRSGFINFYGEQRIGTPGLESIVGVRAFDIGKAMLQRKYSKAIDLLMTGRLVCRGTSEIENDEIRAMRKRWKETNGDPNETWKCIPRGASVPREKLVLKGLKRYGRNEPLSALRCLHYNERIFFLSCYQSYLWNVMATERIHRYGIQKVIPGDLVLGEDDVVVTVDEASCYHYKPEQIVLPLPGYDSLYPANEIGDLYKETLRRDGISFEKDAPLESTAKGSYRRMLAKVTNFSSEAIHGSGDELHFKLTFDLPRGSYATMVLREIMLTTVARE